MLTHTRRQAVDAQAAELRRIERDLHDGAQARLVALTLQLGRAEMRVEDQPEVRQLIADAQREARHAIAELRDLARGIVPPLLADRGLVAAVRVARRALRPRHVDRGRTRTARSRPAVESAAYFVDRRGAHQHRQARPRAAQLGACCASSSARSWCSSATTAAAAPTRGAPASRVCARGCEALDGSLYVESPAGGGTLVEVRLPCA